jgi:tetratricopeptide (TPR) repeat protein
MIVSMTTKKEPWSQTIYFLGVNFLLQGKYEKALIVFHGLMALDQKNYKAIFAYGETLILLNRLEEALDHFLRQAPMFELEKGMVIGAARAFVLLGKLKEATKLLEPLVQCASSQENPYKNQIAKLISDNFFT